MRYRLRLHERLFTVNDLEAPSALAPRNAPRGAVHGTSSKSKSRLVRALACIGRADEPVFVTLTYRDFAADWAEWKADLDRWRHAMEYHYPGFCGVWRLALQQRGAPHFHLLLWLRGEADFAEFEQRATSAWCDAIGQHERANRLYGCDVRRVTNWRDCAAYVAFYQADQAAGEGYTGRTWGLWRKPALCMEPLREFRFDRQAVHLLRRITRRAYLAHCRKMERLPGKYLRVLRDGKGVFQSFLPFAEAVRLAVWVGRESDGITAANVERCAFAWAPTGE